MTRLLSSRWYPAVLQWLSLAFFTAVLAGLLFGPVVKENPANLLVWIIWWPLVCVLFLVAGRVWCSVCPFSRISDAIQRLTGLHLPVPEYLKLHHGWVLVVAFLLLTWLEETTGIVQSPQKTAIMLLAILTGAVTGGLFFKGRTWCRYVCPLGSVSQVYARAALWKLRVQDATCAECATKNCVTPDASYDGCPMHLTPFAIESVSNCNLCGACIKRCPNDALRLTLEAPSADLKAGPSVAPVVGVMVVCMAGLISFLNLMESRMLSESGWFHEGPLAPLASTVLIGLMLGSSALLMQGVSRFVNSRGDSDSGDLTRAGLLGLIPLLLMAHLGHVGMEFWEDGGELTGPLADTLHLSWLHLSGLWGAPWTGYFNATCVGLGAAFSLAVLRWSLVRSANPARLKALYGYGAFIALVALWNIYTAWPRPHEPQPVTDDRAIAATIDRSRGNGWEIVWPFVGINAALIALAALTRGASRVNAAGAGEFSATKVWASGRESTRTQAALLEWLVEQTAQARWKVAAAVRLANAGQEVLTLLQRLLPEDAVIQVRATLRRNRGVLTISHTGGSLRLPDVHVTTDPETTEDALMDGLELRLAQAQVEHLSYQARLSEAGGSFTLRQVC